MYQIDQKKRNDSEFLSFVYKNSKFTISMVSKSLGLTYPTSKRLVDDFVEEGVILIGEKESLLNGRASATFSLNLNKFYSIGVHLELNKISFILIDVLGDVKKESIILNVSYKKEESLDMLKNLFREFYNSIDNDIRDKILGIGISFPGIVNYKKLMIVNSVNLDLKSIEIGNIFEEFHKNVYLENDANACVYSEKIIGQSKEIDNFVAISIGSGMGAGIYLKDSIYHGDDFLAGEFGHVSIDYDGKICNCGNRGCWELYVSEKGIEDELEKVDQKNLEILFDKSRNLEFVQNYIKIFSIGLKNIMFSFDVKNILISGKLSKYIKKYREDIILEVEKNQYLKKCNIDLYFSGLNERSSVLGAALIPVSNYFNLVKKEL